MKNHHCNVGRWSHAARHTATWTSFWCGQGPIANLTRPRYACDSSGTTVQSTYQKVALWKAGLNCEWYAFGQSDAYQKVESRRAFVNSEWNAFDQIGHRIKSHIMLSVDVHPKRNADCNVLVTNTLMHHTTCLFDKYIPSSGRASSSCFPSTPFEKSTTFSNSMNNQRH